MVVVDCSAVAAVAAVLQELLSAQVMIKAVAVVAPVDQITPVA